MIVIDNSNKFFYSTKINDSHFFAGFSTTQLKDTPDNKELSDILAKRSVPFKAVHKQKQVHGADIKVISTDDSILEADGMVSNESDNVLIIKTADCLPILFVDKQSGIVGATHNGWRGTFKNIAKEVLVKMEQLGAKKENIVVAIGPGIGACCYNIPEERYSSFKEKFPEFIDQFVVKRGSNYFLDLTRLNYLLLLENGVQQDNIDHRIFCTHCDKERFFSFRRDFETDRSRFGHMISFITKQ